MTLEEYLHIQLFPYGEYEEVDPKGLSSPFQHCQLCGSFLQGILEYWGTSLSPKHPSHFRRSSTLTPKTLLPAHSCRCGSCRLPSFQGSKSVPVARSPGLEADWLQGRRTPSLDPSWGARAVDLLVGEVRRTQMLPTDPTASADFLPSPSALSAQFSGGGRAVRTAQGQVASPSREALAFRRRL